MIIELAIKQHLKNLENIINELETIIGFEANEFRRNELNLYIAQFKYRHWYLNDTLKKSQDLSKQGKLLPYEELVQLITDMLKSLSTDDKTIRDGIINPIFHKNMIDDDNNTELSDESSDFPDSWFY